MNYGAPPIPAAGSGEKDASAARPMLGSVLVTGAATGIGRAIALGFRDAGWAAHVCDVDAAAALALEESAPGVTASVANVADPDAAARVVADVVDRFGGLDVLVNNAGVAGATAPVEAVSVDDWRRTLDVNVNGPFYFVRAAAPIMKAARRGSIINIASTAALFGYPYRAAYAASKWAMIGFTKTLAMELGPFGVRVNAICPGSVEGPRIEGVIAREAEARGVAPDDVRAVYEAQTSMRTFVRAEDIAAMCLFLASTAGARISGQAIAVDGHTESLSFPFT